MQGKIASNWNSEERKEWVPMKVLLVGKATNLIKGGGGKLSTTGGDPGDASKKPKGGG